LRHFKFEDDYYKSQIDEKDLNELKLFISNIEKNKKPKFSKASNDLVFKLFYILFNIIFNFLRKISLINHIIKVKILNILIDF
jgi:hypothetical protein